MARGTREDPIPRPGSRVLGVDPRDRILLFRTARFWLVPGGGLEGDESHEQAAVREFHEETGHSVAELGPCVWHQRVLWRADNGLWYDSPQRYYLTRTPAFEQRWIAPNEIEVKYIQESRWWGLAEMEASKDAFEPSPFTALLEPLLRGELPERPLDLGRPGFTPNEIRRISEAR